MEVIAGRRGSFSRWKPKLRGRNLAVVGGGGRNMPLMLFATEW